MSVHSAIAAFSYLHTRTKVYLYNTSVIFLMTLPGFLKCRRKFWLSFWIGVLWLVLGAVNGVPACEPGHAVYGTDLKNIDDAIRVSNKYLRGLRLSLSLRRHSAFCA